MARAASTDRARHRETLSADPSARTRRRRGNPGRVDGGRSPDRFIRGTLEVQHLALPVSSNAAVDTYRRLKRRAIEGDELFEVTSDNRTSVIAGTRIDLLDALEEVDTRFGEPVVMRDLQGLDCAEIAQVLDVPVGTVESRIPRRPSAPATPPRLTTGVARTGLAGFGSNVAQRVGVERRTADE